MKRRFSSRTPATLAPPVTGRRLQAEQHPIVSRFMYPPATAVRLARTRANNLHVIST